MDLLFLFLSGCSTPSSPSAVPLEKTSDGVTLDIAYGSEKKAWMEAMISRFAATSPKTPSGRPITVEATASGSGDAMADILSGASKPDVFSPASEAYLKLLDEGWLSTAGHRPLTSTAEPLVLSPLVIAMWKPMAEALGWPGKKLGWADLLTIHRNPQGWASVGHPEWGPFKLGHTHPKQSNSGLLAVLAEAYAGAGVARGMNVPLLEAPSTRTFVEEVEASIVHYGKSTSYFSEQMLSRGPEYLSAAVLYENMVVDSYSKPTPDALPLVSIYPVEGTFWSDHPYAVLEADWVTAEDKAAAATFLQFLKAAPQQEAALSFGFRPSNPSVAVAAPIDAAHGADPLQPQTLLDVPDGATLTRLLALWEDARRTADVTLVFDKSGSMSGRPIKEAKAGALAFLDVLSDRDTLSLQFFDNNVAPATPPALLSVGRASLSATLQGTIPGGGTSLYDAVGEAWGTASGRAESDPRQIHAVVVMTDGRDENSRMGLPALKERLAATREGSVLLFAIAYGEGADPGILEEISKAGGGSTAKGDPDTIQKVFRDMAAFF